MEVTAEGVETLRQLAFLHRHGCDQAQGYLISRPLATADFEEFLKTRQAEPARRRAPVTRLRMAST